jgi:hypothetical protein
MNQKIEKIIVGILFGMIPVVVCFLGGWWLSYLFLPEAWIGPCALGGLLLGILLDVLFFKAGVQRVYSLNPIFWMAVYLFYSICAFGFFMGVPVLNVLLALPAGFFVGSWLVKTGADLARTKKFAQGTAIFTTAVLLIVCVASAVIALNDPYTAASLEGMLNPNFEVTPSMILGIILIGGLAILGMQWWLAKKSVEMTYSFLKAHSAS